MKARAMPSSPSSNLRTSFPLFLAMLLCLLSNQVQAQASLKPHKTANYRPFAIVSSKLKRELSSSFIEERLMCRSTLTTMPEIMDLVQNYDLLHTNAMDGSISTTTFRGRQDGQYVEVMLAVQTANRTLSFIWVGGKPVLFCI